MKSTISTAFFISIFGVAIGWIHASSSSSFTAVATDGNPAPESIEILDINCSVWYQRELKAFETLRLRVASIGSSAKTGFPLAKTGFLLLRVHSFSHPIHLASKLNGTDDPDSFENGTDVGMVRLFPNGEEDSDWFLRSSARHSASANFSVIFRVDFRPASAPIPGGCNLEFTPEIAPQIKTSVVDDVLLEVKFQAAGILKEADKIQCHRPPPPIEYSVYVRSLPVGDVSFRSYSSAVRRMSSPAEIRRNGFPVLTLPPDGNRKTKFFLPVFRLGGTVVSIVATNLDYDNDEINTSAYDSAYVALVNYGCDITEKDSCKPRHDATAFILLPSMLLFGFVSAFLGHHFFRLHLAAYSFLCFAFVAILIVGGATQFSLVKTTLFAAGVGCLGSLFLLWFWWYSGSPLPCVVASGLVLGYLVACLLFALPPLYRSLLDQSSEVREAVFGVVCLCPLAFVYWARGLNIVSTAVCGSYVALASLDLFLDSSRLSEVVWQCLLSNVFPERSPLLLRAGFISTDDAVIIALWIAVAIGGICFQWQREKGNPPFPPHRNLTKGVVDGRLETLPFTPGRGGEGGGGGGGIGGAARPNDDLPPSISQSADYFRRPLRHEWGISSGLRSSSASLPRNYGAMTRRNWTDWGESGADLTLSGTESTLVDTDSIPSDAASTVSGVGPTQTGADASPLRPGI